jgi:hypothetical protein
MTAERLAKAFGGISAVALAATAVLHTMALGQISKLAEATPGDAGTLLPMLWLMFGANLSLGALVVGLVAWRMRPGDQWTLAAVALVPLSAAALQVVYIGFITPTALLLLDGLLVLVSAELARRGPPPAA